MRKYQLKLNDKEFDVHLKDLGTDEAHLEINGKDYSVAISSVSEIIPESALDRLCPSVPAAALKPQSAVVSSDDGTVLAPIPGSILQIFVKVGETVKTGQPLFKMEAMKMENDINARLDGTVTEIKVAAGDSVNQGEVLMLIA
ncbi:MAG: acetyl-CoA carboxylase biotin carboxyl carrier protein subunit [Desulfuromonas sp.]|nr:MAG: acetyl-CoA carboxylase biotin carboxyl carrier protein subunit [Desulfuromonas sp.]